MKKTKGNGNNSPRYISVKWHIMAITTLPMLFACFVITFFASWTLDTGLKNQILIGLKSAATGALISLDNVSTESFRIEDRELYKGDYNVSQNMGALDYYASSNDVEISFYYQDQVYATTLKDDNDARLTGTTAPSSVTNTVLLGGEEYSSSNIQINGMRFYGYYMPVNDTEGNRIGMVFAGRNGAEVRRYVRARILFIILVAVLNYISCFCLANFVSKKRILKPLIALSGAAKELARGNIGQTLKKESNDEFGDLADAFVSLIDNTKEQAHVAEKMAEGNLTVSYIPLSEEDVMGHAITKMIEDNNRNLTTISNASDRMVAGVQDIADASNSLANGTSAQASAVEEITASIEGIASSAEVNANDANHANELIQKTMEEAMLSNDQMHHMQTAMQEINDASQNISKIMKIIDDISSQTNIISLNASVEAARAGEHGKGFAVVAGEIRELANKSAAAAKSSAEMIQDCIQKTAVGSELATKTAESLENILHSVENMTSLISDIAKASADQSTSVSQVNTGISQISNVLQTNSATSEECAATSADLANLASQLKEAVNKYRLR